MIIALNMTVKSCYFKCAYIGQSVGETKRRYKNGLKGKAEAQYFLFMVPIFFVPALQQSVFKNSEGC